MTKHDKLSQKIQNTAQIDILTTGKEAKSLPPGMFPGLKTTKIAAGVLPRIPWWSLQHSPDPLASFQVRGKGTLPPPH